MKPATKNRPPAEPLAFPPHSPQMDKLKPTTEANGQQYDPVVKLHGYTFTTEQVAKLKINYGTDALEIVTERFDALLANLLSDEVEEVPAAATEPIIPASMMPDVTKILPRESQLRFEVMGFIDKEFNLHVQEVRYPRRR